MLGPSCLTNKPRVRRPLNFTILALNCPHKERKHLARAYIKLPLYIFRIVMGLVKRNTGSQSHWKVGVINHNFCHSHHMLEHLHCALWNLHLLESSTIWATFTLKDKPLWWRNWVIMMSLTRSLIFNRDRVAKNLMMNIICKLYSRRLLKTLWLSFHKKLRKILITHGIKQSNAKYYHDKYVLCKDMYVHIAIHSSLGYNSM